MTTHSQTLLVLDPADLRTVTGGAGVDFSAVRQQARQYCPQTAAKYAGVDPSKLNRSKAQAMGNSCLAEMGSFKAAFARGTIQDAIDKTFPR